MLGALSLSHVFSSRALSLYALSLASAPISHMVSEQEQRRPSSPPRQSSRRAHALHVEAPTLTHRPLLLPSCSSSPLLAFLLPNAPPLAGVFSLRCPLAVLTQAPLRFSLPPAAPCGHPKAPSSPFFCHPLAQLYGGAASTSKILAEIFSAFGGLAFFAFFSEDFIFPVCVFFTGISFWRCGQRLLRFSAALSEASSRAKHSTSLCFRYTYAGTTFGHHPTSSGRYFRRLFTLLFWSFQPAVRTVSGLDSA